MQPEHDKRLIYDGDHKVCENRHGTSKIVDARADEVAKHDGDGPHNEQRDDASKKNRDHGRHDGARRLGHNAVRGTLDLGRNKGGEDDGQDSRGVPRGGEHDWDAKECLVDRHGNWRSLKDGEERVARCHALGETGKHEHATQYHPDERVHAKRLCARVPQNDREEREARVSHCVKHEVCAVSRADNTRDVENGSEARDDAAGEKNVQGRRHHLGDKRDEAIEQASLIGRLRRLATRPPKLTLDLLAHVTDLRSDDNLVLAARKLRCHDTPVGGNLAVVDHPAVLKVKAEPRQTVGNVLDIVPSAHIFDDRSSKLFVVIHGSPTVRFVAHAGYG